jgi:hypothetical protein
MVKYISFFRFYERVGFKTDDDGGGDVYSFLTRLMALRMQCRDGGGKNKFFYINFVHILRLLQNRWR